MKFYPFDVYFRNILWYFNVEFIISDEYIKFIFKNIYI